MIQTGVALMLAAFVLFCTGGTFPAYAVSMALLGAGIGLLRPGSAAGASLAVDVDEQGSVAGLVGGVSVIGNVVGPLIGTTIYEIGPLGPYAMNAVIMAAVLAYLLGNRRLRRI
jgi:predicted MFS family arabinose efflux permease